MGLPNSGKSSLYNALTGANSPVAPHPFSTTETATGTAIVRDPRLDRLATMSSSKKTVYTHIEVVDIMGVSASSGAAEGLGNRFLAGIREVDAIIYVLRAFKDGNVVGEDDPVSSLESLELELVLADTIAIETLLERRRKSSRTDKSHLPEIAALEEALAVTSQGTPIYRSRLSEETLEILRASFLLTHKKVLAVINCGEDQVGSTGAWESQIAEMLGGNASVLSVSVQLEAEAMGLDPAERAELLEGLGLGEGALARVARGAYAVLGRSTFFTTGDKESRAWTFRTGAKAPECAGVIHSDLQRGFIRAEIIHWEDLLAIGAWTTAKSTGKIRVEGKEYTVKDGDVLEIRFNV